MASVPQSPWFCSLKGSVPSTYKNPKNLTLKTLIKVSSSSSGSSGAESSSPNSPNKSSEPDPGDTDPVKLAFTKAKAYKKSIQSNPNPGNVQNPVSESAELGQNKDGSVSGVANGGNKAVPIAAKLSTERAREYGKNKDVESSSKSREGGLTEVERDDLGNTFVGKSINKKGGPSTISSIDFVGLNFSDKRESRGLPPGLVPVSDPFPEGDLPEVEIIVGDASKFEDTVASKPKTNLEDNSDLYKPKVSTWGVFPRPSNISETYGGGKTIRPGEVLETAEDKAAKEARTRQLLAAYKNKIGLNIDPKLKSECEKVLKDGDSLMDLGKLKEALPFYEKVMDKMAFKTELHGLAALQWSICQDSLSRSNEARVMYEKLQSHPNVQVSKKAREFIFSFQAMEMMKVTSSTLYRTRTDYQNYFEAFIRDKEKYPLIEAEVDEGALTQALPYIIFLFSPIFIVLLIAIQKGI